MKLGRKMSTTRLHSITLDRTRFTADYIEEYLERRRGEVESLDLEDDDDMLYNLSISPHGNYSGPIMNDIFTCPREVADALSEFIRKFPDIVVHFYSAHDYTVNVSRFQLIIESDQTVVDAYHIVAGMVGAGSDNVAGWLFKGIEHAVYVINDIEEPDDVGEAAEAARFMRFILPYLELLGLLPLR